MDMSSKRKRKCCVENCFNETSKRHRFPIRELDIFQHWVDRIKPPNYESFTVKQIYNKFLVCESHFARDTVMPDTRRGLMRNALPTLNIPGFEEVERQDLNLPEPYSTPDMSPVTCRAAEEESSTSMDIFESFFRPEDTTSPVSISSGSDRQLHPTPERIGPSRSSLKKDVSVRKVRQSILSRVNVRKAIDLTPKARKLYGIITTWRKKMDTTESKSVSFKERLRQAERLASSDKFIRLARHVNDATYYFLMRQIRNQNLTPKSRRYTLDEKILALSLFKSTGKGYRLLDKIFALPSPRTLNALLSKIPFSPGINVHIFNSLRDHVGKMTDEKDKMCILLFDEMAIDTNISYKKEIDAIVGFQDNGTEKYARFANYVNVFMLRGLCRQWKQPVAFTFSHSHISQHAIKNMIKRIIFECHAIGLKVIATLCDQGATNSAVINALLQETKEHFLRRNEVNPLFGFLVGDLEVVPVFDPPHLIKGLRNHLLNKELHFIEDEVNKIARWDHVRQFYELDQTEPNIRICSKLTDSHIYAASMNKMKVKTCTQVFSNTVGSLMKRISKWNISDGEGLPEGSEDTADLILFLDKLFDSLNVSRRKREEKLIKRIITNESVHGDFWDKAIEQVETMKFYSFKKQKFECPPTLKHLSFTLKAFIYLKSKLLGEFKLNYMLSGAFNQDPLENFFGFMRSHYGRNTNPSVDHFISSSKALICNNFRSSHSPGSNCEKDITTGALDNLRRFITGEVIAGVSILKNEPSEPEIHKELSFFRQTKISRPTSTFMTVFIVKQMLKVEVIRNCSECKLLLTKKHTTTVQIDDFIDITEYDKGHLQRPGLTLLFTYCLHYLFYLIPRLCTSRKLTNILETIVIKHLCFKALNCSYKHNLGNRVLRMIIRYAICLWSRAVNKVLKGKNSKFTKFLQSKPAFILGDPIKRIAFETYKKCLKTKKSKL